MGRDADAPVGNVHGLSDLQPHVAVDARAGVPAAILLGGVVHLDHKHVVLGDREVRREIQAKGRVAVRMASDEVLV